MIRSTARILWLGTLGLVAAAVLAAAPVRPDFSGVWKLDPDKSDFAGQAKPGSKVQTVVQKGNDLVVTLDEVMGGKPVRATSRYALDGTEVTNDALGNPMKATVSWDGEAMVMRTWGNFGGADILLIDRWALSGDGRTLTMKRHFEGHGRVADQTLVYEKQ